MTNEPNRPLASAALALAGPVALGAVIGLRQGIAPMALGGITVPAVLGGIAAMTIPALYIGSTLAGVAPPAHVTASAVARAARANGIVLLGLAAPAAFLISTTTGGGAAAIGSLALGAATLAALRVVFADMFPAADLNLDKRVRAAVVFTCWAAMALALGALLMTDAINDLHVS